jgi:prepilin-type N-terminal cleavage/methylation domain-containing protein
MKQHRRQQHIGRKGFTLVETLVAISILLVAIVGPMTIAAKGLQSAFYAREQITAFWLGQEGVELVRELRDQSALEHENWLANIPPSCGNANGCGLDARGVAVNNCTAGNNCRLNYDDGPLAAPGHRGFYTHAAGTPSQYTRRIFVQESSNNKEAIVTVEVSWQSGLFGAAKTVTIQSRIFNQYDNI